MDEINEIDTFRPTTSNQNSRHQPISILTDD